jgi:hypothetical protein
VKLIELKQPNLRDVPDNMELVAQKIRDGLYGPVNHAICVLESPDGDLEIVTLGDCGSLANEMGVLNLAALQLALEDSYEEITKT